MVLDLYNDKVFVSRKPCGCICIFLSNMSDTEIGNLALNVV